MVQSSKHQPTRFGFDSYDVKDHAKETTEAVKQDCESLHIWAVKRNSMKYLPKRRKKRKMQQIPKQHILKK